MPHITQSKKKNQINTILPSVGEPIYRNCARTIHSSMMAESSMKSWTYLSESNNLYFENITLVLLLDDPDIEKYLHTEGVS